MPGILMMNHSANDSVRDGENKKRSFEGNFVNGDRHKDPAAMNNAIGNVASNGVSDAVSAPATSNSPPEIAKIGPEAYHPLSKLLARMAQECYNGLEETLHKMSDTLLGEQANGALLKDNLEVNKRKKMLLLKFAQDNRAKFIKLLVLTEWGQKSAFDIGKVIDLYAWAKEQAAHMDFADEQINQIKILSAYARENNPDIRTALEVLSTGEAPWIPTVRTSTNRMNQTVLTLCSWTIYHQTLYHRIRH